MLLTFNFPSRVRERLKPEFLVSALMALMAPDFTSCLACSVAVAVSTTGCSDSAGERVRGRGERHYAGCGGGPILLPPLDCLYHSQRLTPPWLAVPLLLCFFRASNAFFWKGERSVRREVCQPRHWPLRCVWHPGPGAVHSTSTSPQSPQYFITTLWCLQDFQSHTLEIENQKYLSPTIQAANKP